jgi:predicted membrane chloride channel (bestrophin family)
LRIYLISTIKYFKDYDYSHAMKLLRSAVIILSPNTVIVAMLSVLATYLCIHYEVYADFPLTLIGIAVVFPIVFSISTAYARREKALVYYGSLKANGRAIFFASRDWVPQTDRRHQEKLKGILRGLLRGLRLMFMEEKEKGVKYEKIVYSKFSEISKFLKECGERGMPTSGQSRSNQYMSKMIDSFESMKHIYQYRTPVTLRAYSKIFTYILPIFYGPYFANLAREIPMALFFVMPVLLSIILVSLDNIQDHLENPFDMVGEDDVVINEDKFTAWLDL